MQRSNARLVSPSVSSQQPLLVCFSHLRWDFVWQRPQHLLSRAAAGYRVIVVEEPVYEFGARISLRMEDRAPVRIATPVLPHGLSPTEIISAQRDLVGRMLARERGGPRVFWYYTPMALAFTADFDCDVCVYDNMDELAAFKGASPELLALEDELFARADVVFTGGMSLYEAKKSRHPNVHGFPSSIETAHFGKARGGHLPEPAELAGLARPRLGFFGVVDERMNVDLVGEVAALRPDWNLVMIGPVVKIDPADLPQRDNIHWLGGRAYADLPVHLAHWDLGFMPFAINEATRFISPTKTPEFLAAGLPVVSTPITDVVRPYGEKGLVRIARTAAEVVEAAEALLSRSEREKAQWLARVDRHLAAGSWDKTWRAMNALVEAEMILPAASTGAVRVGSGAYATPAE